jgi:aconitase A
MTNPASFERACQNTTYCIMPRSVTMVQPALANWKPNAVRTQEIAFVVSRVVLQDFTGVRRGNHDVMMRGTFANLRIKNLMAA